MILLKTTTVVVLVTLMGFTNNAHGAGDYVPKSYYFIDQFGHRTEPVSIRSKRDLVWALSSPLHHRIKRGGGYAAAGSQASAGSGVNHEDIIGQVQSFLNNIPGAVQSFARAGSSNNAGFGVGGPSSGQSYGGLGSGQQAGYQGPILFSRFGEAQGTGVHVSGQAAGPNAAFASSSSSIDDQGKIKYSVQSGKY
ncbi:filaggrin-2-like [Euwallacea similis]|uniref:filaggrin-2-like n=1 Tax=Euwallacea similis TaxID=1736056 RepID=UPI00344B16BF